MGVASIRLLPSSLSCLAPLRHSHRHHRRFSWKWRTSLPTIGFRVSPIQSRLHSTSANVDTGVELPDDQSEIIFMGTGTSEGIPRVSCLTNTLEKCPVCSKAAEPGLDDLRDWTNNVQPSIPIYVAKRDFEVMKKTHYYLVDTSVIVPGAAVSELQFNIISEEPFFVHGLKFTPLPVWHGQGYRSLGFRFGNVCYISDASEIPEETYELLKDCEILILDALRPDRSSSTHFGLPRALEEVRKIRPKRTFFTGMMHLMDHEEVNGNLSELWESEGLDVQLSYDGLRLLGRL